MEARQIQGAWGTRAAHQHYQMITSNVSFFLYTCIVHFKCPYQLLNLTPHGSYHFVRWLAFWTVCLNVIINKILNVIWVLHPFTLLVPLGADAWPPDFVFMLCKRYPTDHCQIPTSSSQVISPWNTMSMECMTRCKINLPGLFSLLSDDSSSWISS